MLLIYFDKPRSDRNIRFCGAQNVPLSKMINPVKYTRGLSNSGHRQTPNVTVAADRHMLKKSKRSQRPLNHQGDRYGQCSS
jgi:hypothetical protein